MENETLKTFVILYAKLQVRHTALTKLFSNHLKTEHNITWEKFEKTYDRISEASLSETFSDPLLFPLFQSFGIKEKDLID